MSDRAALKQAIRARMLALEEEELATAVSHYESFLNDSRLDKSEAHDLAEIAEARESADLAAAFDHPVQAHHAKVDAIENADFSLKDEVAPGAVLAFGGRNFVALVPTAAFECEGKTYMGISQQSPIFRKVQGMGEGDTFEHNGQTFTLDEVF